MKSFFSNMKLSHRILAPNLLFLLVLVIAIYIALHSGGMINTAAVHQKELSDIQTQYREAVLGLQQFVSGAIMYEELSKLEHELIKNSKKVKGLPEIACQVSKYLAEFEKLNQANAAFEAEILKLSGIAINASNTYIGSTVKRLADENEKLQVTTLERLVIGGALNNTVSNYQLQLHLQKVKQHVEAKTEAFSYIEKMLKNVDQDINNLANTPFLEMATGAKQAILKIRDDFEIYADNLEKQNELKINAFKTANKATALIDSIGKKENTALFEEFKSYFRMIAIFLTIAVIVAIGLALVVVFRVSKSLVTSISGIDYSADQVVEATAQVSSASQSLADGASNQAASLEETSSSLEEITAMTQQNATNAAKADELMKDAGAIVGQANKNMEDVIASMDQIAKASDETSNIIKTIDEIAFQTNLLALNAAVEAARAGEAGAGFAVVADEVRNLAMRAAEAAKSTNALIEDTGRKVAEGSNVVNLTNDSFAKVVEHASQVADLVSKIATASSEQAEGVKQINMAVTTMDKVIQQNAASSEETASAAQEMAAQADQMKILLKDLSRLTGANGSGSDHTVRCVGKAYHQLEAFPSTPVRESGLTWPNRS